MIVSLLEFSLRQRILVLGLACLLSVVGIFAFQSIPIDAYPDVTNIQVQVLTEASGLSPIEVERFITYPLELQLTGLPGMEEIRSLSKFALSQITVVFRDDIDIYFARQLVLERIMAAREQLPEGLDPVMAPVTTGLGEVYQYYMEGPEAGATDPAVVERALTDQRTMQEWVLRPLLKSVPGVIDVNGMGGFVKQYQVLVDPARLRKFDLTLHQIYEAVVKNNVQRRGQRVRTACRPLDRSRPWVDQDRRRYRVHHREGGRRHAGVHARCRRSPHPPRRTPWGGGSEWRAGGGDRHGAHASRRQCPSSGRSR
ncbi:MAG: efflux RND transporter permease subunit [Nitrospira sp.]|nr:efflux RND transporter permease subunit [Nitrospira sp.]